MAPDEHLVIDRLDSPVGPIAPGEIDDGNRQPHRTGLARPERHPRKRLQLLHRPLDGRADRRDIELDDLLAGHIAGIGDANRRLDGVGDAKYPWPLGLMVYQGEYGTAWQLVLAFITLTILPAIVMFVFAQRHLVTGLTAGAVKG